MVKNLHFLKFIVFTVFFAVVTSANSPIIDGVINEGEWNDAIEYELEFEVSPGRNAPALLKTFAQIKHDDENLYVAFRAFALRFDPKMMPRIKNFKKCKFLIMI